jgi:succinoglycan biosynthesis protein ExoO
VTDRLTVCVIARNAEAVIDRAVRSVRSDGDWPILLVDDASADRTAEIAREAAGEAITVVSAGAHLGPGGARSLALKNLETPYGLWLDADDELAPGRVERVLKALETGAHDLVVDEAELVDDATGAVVSTLTIPDFIDEGAGLYRLFERNWLPILTMGFTRAFARRVDFDPALTCSEDYDFLRRALWEGGRIALVRQSGYRYHHAEDTISRDIPATRAAARALYAKQPPDAVRAFVQAHGLSEAEAIWIAASGALAGGDRAATRALAALLRDSAETVPPYAQPLGWLSRFLIASCDYLEGAYADALAAFEGLAEHADAADASCNAAAAAGMLGRFDDAAWRAKRALDLRPGYRDAGLNIVRAAHNATSGYALTPHPLRRAPTRDVYR